MKNVRFWLLLGALIPCSAFGANGSDFQSAVQLLSAARRGDTRTVQYLINSGVDINYTDSTGLSLVCTAVMNNDKRAIQILQMYGADASNCDKQIKKYRQRKNVAANGEEYDFFSGLSSSHIVALSAVGIAAVIGGVTLLTDAFDSENNNGSSSSGGGSHGSGSGGGDSGSSASKSFTVPYGPAYINATTGEVNANDTSKITGYLSEWSATTGAAYATDFNYIRRGTDYNYMADGLNPLLENYLLVMGGYYPMANGYMGQYTHRKDPAKQDYTPVLSAIEGNPQGRPVRVALITDNGINPAGSADSANGITYAVGTAVDAATPHVDKYLNNTANPVTDTTGLVVSYDLTENSGFDLSGSGSAFNPFANVDDSALAKIVAGWEGDERSYGDLYGFVPNGQLAIYRTGAGSVWQNKTGAPVGTFTNKDTDDNVLSAGDIIELNGQTYLIENAVGSSTVTNPTVTVNVKTYNLASASKMFVAKCTSDTSLSNIAIYIGTDGNWYVNTSGGDDINAVYAVDSGNNIYEAKERVSTGYSNFTAMTLAAAKTYSVGGTTDAVDVIANTSVIPASRQNYYVTTDTLAKAMSIDGRTSNIKTFYQGLLNSEYGVYESVNQGDLANNLFNGYSSDKPMIVMPAGDYTMGIVEKNGTTISREVYLNTLEATFENYAPMLYSNLSHNFMTIVGVSHNSDTGTSTATSVDNYGDGIGGSYGKLQLSVWANVETDSVTGNTTTTTYASRMCGLAGVGNAAQNIDPWCFAASGPTAEMATASAAGAVASIKSAFSYMDNDQIYTLLALTADGPYLNANTDGTKFTTDSLAAYLQDMYQLPLEYNITGLSSEEYLNLFKTVFGYGLINVRRAIKPGFSVYYYDGTTKNIVSAKGNTNRYWGKTSARSSSVLSLSGRSAIKTSFYDIIESPDGTMSLPRVWNSTIAMDGESKHGLYMGDVLGDFNVDSTNKRTNKIGNLTIDMAVSSRAYDDDMNGLDDMRITFSNDSFDFATEYQHYLTNGESRFNGRANGLLNLVSDSISVDAMYKYGNFAFGGSAFVGAITDENLLDKDPVVSSQFEPGRLGFANGGAIDAKYNNDKFGLNMSFGVMHENNTVLGMMSDGMLTLNGADTKYIDAVTTYKPFENVKLSLRGTYAITDAVADGLLISDMSNIQSNSFAFGVDVGGFSFTAAMPLAVVDGKMDYGYADFEVVENDGKYEIATNNMHTEHLDLSAVKRELRFTTMYKQSLGEWTDAGVGFVYRVNPNNTDAFGSESIFMFKLHHRLGI
jgi:hypothetical protein